MKQVDNFFLLQSTLTLSRFLWVVSLTGKTSAACRQAVIDVIEGLKQGQPVSQHRFCRGSKPVSPNPEKIRVDIAREFAREFANFSKQSGVHLSSTCGETKSVFAESNIRSIKSFFFIHLHDINTEVYHEDLQAFVDIIKSRVNRVTKLARNQVKKLRRIVSSILTKL